MRQSQLGWWVEKGYDATTAEIKYKDHQARAGLARSEKLLKKLQEFFLCNKIFGDHVLLNHQDIYRGNDIGKRSGFYVKVACRCGVERVVNARLLISGKTTGCRSCKYRNGGPKNNRWSGYKELTGTIFHGIRGSAKTRQIPFELTIEELYNLYHTQLGLCALSGVEISWYDASLDRIDSNGKYEFTNVQWVHKKVNIMKHTMSDKELRNWCQLIIDHRSV